MQGIAGSARRVAAHAAALGRLERELAQHELRRKGASLGAGAGLALAALLLLPLVGAFGLATAAAALALAVPWWLALLIVFAVLLAIVIGLVVGSVALVRRAGAPIPEQALEEARLARERLGSGRG
jgi:hypothetical protein